MAATSELGLDELRALDLLEDLDDEQLERWRAAAELRVAPAGEVLVEQGADPPGLHLLLEGVIEALMVDEGRIEPVGLHRAPTWMGAIPLLTEGPVGVRIVTQTACRLALVPPPAFLDLVLSQRPVHRRIMRQVRPVVARITAMSQNRERLASLGTMAAGLAHELNNPAAAARRAAAEMAEALEVLGDTVGRFVESGLERDGAERLVVLQREALERGRGRSALATLDAADAEDELLERLEELGVDEPWRLAEPLAAAGVDADWLRAVSDQAGPATTAALQWVAASLTARGLAEELRESAERMSTLVGAVKSYAYMDRGAVNEVDVHEGLETTLVVLGHKLKHTRIQVVRAYERTLPMLTVHGSELNQVWTNLLDNAIDALGQEGTITLTTSRDGPSVVVEVADDGPGIAPEVLDRIYDPFFTTKGVGAGTGLGLDTARRIVEERHRGSLAVASEPGRTAFRVRLPVEA